MITIIERAYAKINLTLDVRNKRADGYHEIESVMQTVSLHDDIYIRIGTGNPWELTCTDEQIPTDCSNHAWKAAEVFFRAMESDPDGLDISITKRIPSQAGMGGGSADAAAVLRALNGHYGKPFSDSELAKLAEQVGSDVPFCVLGGTKVARGRGEILECLPPMPPCWIVICKPDFSCSTPALYRQIDETVIAHRPNFSAMYAAMEIQDLRKIGENLCNVFDALAETKHPEIEQFKETAISNGALGAQMTGSGSALFAIFDSQEKAQRILQELQKDYEAVFICNPV